MASIFKNPFEVAKDQLIRQVFELPVRIAAVVESRKKHLRTDELECLYGICASTVAAEEEGELIHSIANEKKHEDVESAQQEGPILGVSVPLGRIEGVAETWQGPESEALNSGKRKRGVVECLGPAPSNIPNIMAGSMNTSSIHKRLEPYVKKPPLTAMNDDNEYLIPSKSTDEQVTEVRKEREGNSFKDAKKTGQSAGQDEVVLLPPPSASKKTTHDIAVFLLTIIRTLRHTRHGNTQKLFEVLSSGGFLVDNYKLLEELMDLAYLYNKDAVAKELSQQSHQPLDG